MKRLFLLKYALFVLFLYLLFTFIGCATSSGNLYNNVRKTENIKPGPTKKPETSHPVNAKEENSTGTQPKKIPVLKISSSPSGASVYLDNSYYGTTPLNIKDLPQGSYSIQLSLEGYLSVNSNFKYTGNDEFLHYILKKINVLMINSDPAGADIYIDNDYTGYTPLKLTGFSVGRHSVRIEKEGYVTEEKTIEYYPNGDFTVHFKLVPRVLIISTDPDEAEVYIDDQYAGKSPVTLYNPEQREYRIRVDKPGFLESTRNAVYNGGKENIEIKLAPGNIVFIDSSPKGAEVIINDIYRGETPCQFIEPVAGEYTIRLEKDNYYPDEVTVQCDGKPQYVDRELILITGYLALSTKHEDIVIYLDNKIIQPGKHKLVIGSHSLSVDDLFGYKKYEKAVLIEEKQTTAVDVKLEECELEWIDFKQDKDWFDPAEFSDNYFLIQFKVNAPCDGNYKVMNEYGEIVWSEENVMIKQEDNSFKWYGSNRAGNLLPDGLYKYSLELTGKNKGTVLKKEGKIQLDHDHVYAHSTAFCGINGLLYTGNPFTLAESSLLFQALFVGHSVKDENTGKYYLERTPVSLAFSYGILSQLQATLQCSLTGKNTYPIPLYISGSLIYRYFVTQINRLLFSSALSVKGTYHYGTSTDTFTNFTGVSAGLPSAIKVYGLHILLHPEVILSPWQIDYNSEPLGYLSEMNWTAWLYFRGGILLDFHFCKLGVSAAVHTESLQDGFRIGLPFQMGYEFSFSPVETFTLSVYIIGEIESFSSYYYMGGVGVSLLLL